MKKVESKGKQHQENKENTQREEFLSRRKVLKKAAYVAPALIILGVVTPLEASAQLPSGGPPDPPPPGE